jgi:hypothetical protein
MKKLFFIVLAALSLGLISCNKTCSCTETVTETLIGEWAEDFGPEPQVSTASFNKEAKHCEDLNVNLESNTFAYHTTDVVICK